MCSRYYLGILANREISHANRNPEREYHLRVREDFDFDREVDWILSTSHDLQAFLHTHAISENP